MKICMVVLNNFTHDARVRREARALAAEGHTVTVLALKDETVSSTEEMDGFRVIRVPLCSRNWGKGLVARGTKLIEYFLRTLREALHTRADVYHAHDANTLAVGWLASQLRRVRLVYDAHEFEQGRDWGSSNLPSLFRRLWTLPERLFIGSADLVITVSDSIADELRHIYHIARPTVIMNCPDQAMLGVSNRLREELSISPDQPIALYQGGLAADRGLHTFIEGAVQVPSLTVVIIGGGPLLEPLREWVRQKEWEPRIYFLGHIPLDDLPEYTASADVGVVLYRNVCLNHYYCLPNKLFEYIQAGLPVITSDFPDLRRIVQRNEVGQVVDPESPQAVAQALHAILHNRDKKDRIRANVLAASRIYNWERESRKLVNAYREFISADH